MPGVNLAFFSGNEVFWKTRWENSIDGSGTPYRTLVCYKETHDYPLNPDPTNVWTGTWRDPRGTPPADGGRPENALIGHFIHGQCRPYHGCHQGTAEDGKMRFWRNTSRCLAGGWPDGHTFATGPWAASGRGRITATGLRVLSGFPQSDLVRPPLRTGRWLERFRSGKRDTPGDAVQALQWCACVLHWELSSGPGDWI